MAGTKDKNTIAGVFQGTSRGFGFLTPEGLEMARESFLAQTDMEKRLLTMLSPEEKEQLRTLLKRILLDLEERGEV